MPLRVFETEIDAPVARLAEFHRSSTALESLTPPDRQVELLTEDPSVTEGSVHTMRIRQFGIPMVWQSKITQVEEGRSFTDEAIRSPFAKWRHKHEFLPLQDDRSLLRDTVEYEAPLGPLGVIAHRLFIDRQIEELFAYRHRVTKKMLEASPEPASRT